MAPESIAERKKRLSQIMAKLEKVYPDARVELNYSSPLELLIATILSAQCTDKRVNAVTEKLFKKYRTAADYANASIAELEKEIKPTGFYRNKVRTIQAVCKLLVEKYGGQVPASMEMLTALPGVGRKTANVVLGNAFGINAGIVVDTHVSRVARRLRLTNEEDPEKIERDLMELVARDRWTKLGNLLIWHGRRRCKARKPDCANCEIRDLCPSAGKEDKK